MERKIYRAAVIGCGKIGSSFSTSISSAGIHSHAQAYSENPRIQLVGLSDADAAHLAEAHRRWNVPVFPEATDLCRQTAPDIISICTPDSTHFAIAREILEISSPKMIFMEKPLALKASEAQELLALAKAKNCAVSVNFSRRFSPAIQILREELHQGTHGAPILFRMLYGKGLLHNGSHAIDLMRFWLGEPSEASGRPTAWGPEKDATYEIDWMFSSGCRARFDSFDERKATVFEMDLLTEKSRWRFWSGGAQWEFSEVRENASIPGYRNYLTNGREKTDIRFQRPMADCLKNAIDNLVAHLDGEAELLSTGTDGLAALEWSERIIQGALSRSV